MSAIWMSVSLVVRETDAFRVVLMMIIPHGRING
jgi:hypothetical protein